MREKLLELLDSKGRLHYQQFVEFVRTLSLESFVSLVRHPLLMGKELYEGQLEEMRYQSSSTMPFHRSVIQAMLNPHHIQHDESLPIGDEKKESPITKAVFMLVKRRGARGEINEITIGRNQENDLIIADYSVSKHHCRIRIQRTLYSIIDENSTNGTFFNDQQLEPNVEYRLPPDNDIAFGRLVFRFISPQELYRLIVK